jgi:hypothetical protein
MARGAGAAKGEKKAAAGRLVAARAGIVAKDIGRAPATRTVAGGARPGLTEKKPHAMKKMLFVVLVSLAGVGLTTERASAWLLCHHCCKSCATICVRPYNAFSPSAFGTICADGCCPLQFGQCAPPPGMGGPPPWACGGPDCGMDGSCGSCAAGAPVGAPTMVTAPGNPTMLPPGGTVPTFQAPTPAPMPPGPTTGHVGYPTGLQTAGYRPGYYAPMPWMQPPMYPAYWNMPNPYGR